MYIEYIYKPQDVEGVLKRYPSIYKKLGSPSQEGQISVGFPQCRKTGREIYRILSNQHYPHLVELLKALDYCIANGWVQPALLRTQGRKEFDSSVSELFIAEFFLKRGFKVRGFEEDKKQKSIPDMLVTSEKESISVEVYCPRDWNGLEYFLEELMLGILHLDIPWDFSLEINMRLMHCFDSMGNILWFDPWKFSDAFDTPAKRWTKIGSILSQVETAITDHRTPKIIECLRDENLNILVEARENQARKSQGQMPNRRIFLHPPSITGYAPEGMFDQLVKRRVLKKIQKGQTQSLPGNNIKALCVDISKLGYRDEFFHPYYLQSFGKSIENHLDHNNNVGVDIVAFCLHGVPTRTDMAIPVIFRKPSISEEICGQLFGENHSFTDIL